MLGALGWYWWLHGGVNRTALVVRRTPVWGAVAVVGFVAVATWLIYTLLTTHTDSIVPLGDALTTALSLGAQMMLNRKWIDNWWLWIAADVLYITKGLYLTAILYVLFLTMCFIGLRQWCQAAKDAEAAGGVADLAEAAVEPVAEGSAR